MRKFFLIIFAVIAFVFVVTTGTVNASGDKVRGDKADGPAFQLGECPFTG